MRLHRNSRFLLISIGGVALGGSLGWWLTSSQTQRDIMQWQFMQAVNGLRPSGEFAPYYYNCAHARAMGAAPIYAGEPGYRPELDADNDGIACEPYPRRW